MKKGIFLSSLVIVLVVALTAAVTWAYFSGTKDENATITTATISIDGLSSPCCHSMPLRLAPALLPSGCLV